MSDTWREVFEEYRQANDDLLKLVEALLAVSRYEAGYGDRLSWDPLNWEKIFSQTTAPRILVIALSALDNDNQVMGMLAAGADGYCHKDMEWEQLVAAIRLIQSGGAYLDSHIAQKVTRMLKPTVAEPEVTASGVIQHPVLSSREREILKLIAEGHSNQKMAQQLYLSVGSVKSYVRMLLNKLSVDDRVQAAALAIRERLI